LPPLSLQAVFLRAIGNLGIDDDRCLAIGLGLSILPRFRFDQFAAFGGRVMISSLSFTPGISVISARPPYRPLPPTVRQPAVGSMPHKKDPAAG